MADSDVLLTDVQGFTEVLLGTLERTVESFYETSATDDAAKAIKAWTIFSVVIMLDFADAALILSRADKRRPMLPISRSMYEFFITLAYFDRHRDLAVQQLQTATGRRLLRASKTAYATAKEQAEFGARYEEWATYAKSQNLTAFSGNRNFQDMAFEIEGESKEHHPTYAGRYGIASMITHPDGGAIPDVLYPVGDEGIRVVWRSESMDPTILITNVNELLIRTILLLSERFNGRLTNFDDVLRIHEALNRRVLQAKGLDPDTLLGEPDAQ